MKMYILYILVGCAVISGAYFYNHTPRTESTHNHGDALTASVSASDQIKVDLSLCNLQQESVYRCPANALANFGPVTIANTGQTTSCRISYDAKNGYSFEGPNKSAQLSAGEFLVSVTDTGAIANIVRNNESKALTFFVGGSERIVHVMIVDGKDYSSDQCLEI